MHVSNCAARMPSLLLVFAGELTLPETSGQTTVFPTLSWLIACQNACAQRSLTWSDASPPILEKYGCVWEGAGGSYDECLSSQSDASGFLIFVFLACQLSFLTIAIRIT
jgi:hypothetical protein